MEKEELIGLIERSLQGDKSAFNTVIKSCDGSVRGYVVALCGNEFDSNDILQETYIKAFLNLAKYNPKYPMNVWLKTIAHNIFIDIKRAQSRSVTPYFDEQNVEDVDDISPEQIIITKERIKSAEKELSRLSPTYRKIVDLRYFREMSYNEIAEEMDIPIGTVKTQLFRARKLLSQIICDLNEF